QNMDGLYIFRDDFSVPSCIVPCTQASKAAFHPAANSLITCGIEGLRLWPLNFSPSSAHLTIGPPQMLCSKGSGNMNWFSMTPDGSRLAVNSDDGFRVLDPLHPAAVVHSRLLSRAGGSISPDGRWVVAGDSIRRLQIWNARSGALVTNITLGGKSNVRLA